jgi:hypothetical protein
MLSKSIVAAVQELGTEVQKIMRHTAGQEEIGDIASMQVLTPVPPESRIYDRPLKHISGYWIAC